MPEIDMEKCNLCGLCVEVCKCGAIIIEKKVIVFTKSDLCGWCTICEAVCPTGALTCPYDIVVKDK
ncbi:MAG TPA: 4Fe-4S binding protein [Dehalococcoidales bacterium]|nr:4Fe-4S binding protein [Dehalococcoidales bacterium]